MVSADTVAYVQTLMRKARGGEGCSKKWLEKLADHVEKQVQPQELLDSLEEGSGA